MPDLRGVPFTFASQAFDNIFGHAGQLQFVDLGAAGQREGPVVGPDFDVLGPFVGGNGFAVVHDPAGRQFGACLQAHESEDAFIEQRMLDADDIHHVHPVEPGDVRFHLVGEHIVAFLLDHELAPSRKVECLVGAHVLEKAQVAGVENPLL